MERYTLGDYGRLDNLDEVAQGFNQQTMSSGIKNSILTALKVNKYSGKDDEDCNIHLTYFLEVCSTINPDVASKSDK